MAGEPVVTIVGNIAGEVDLRYAASGVAVASWTVASTPRTKDKESDRWVDGETMWVRCTAFRQDAENAAESLSKGTRVIVTGRMSQETWETKEGEKRTSLKLMVDEVGASVKFALVTVRKPGRASEVKRESAPPAHDPWATSNEEIPF